MYRLRTHCGTLTLTLASPSMHFTARAGRLASPRSSGRSCVRRSMHVRRLHAVGAAACGRGGRASWRRARCAPHTHAGRQGRPSSSGLQQRKPGKALRQAAGRQPDALRPTAAEGARGAHSPTAVRARPRRGPPVKVTAPPRSLAGPEIKPWRSAGTCRACQQGPRSATLRVVHMAQGHTATL